MAAKASVRPVRAGDIEALLASLRQADRDEVEAAAGDVEHALVDSVQCSVMLWAGEIDGELACIFGCAPLNGLLGLQAAPWMLGTDLLDRHPCTLMRHCRQYIEAMQARYPCLMNFVDARNKRSVRWLRRMGFTIHNPVPYGLAQLPFHPFERRA